MGIGKGAPEREKLSAKEERLLRLCEREPENWRGILQALEAGADPAALSEWGSGGLSLLARAGGSAGARAARALLDAGAPPDGSGPEDRPLLEAAWQGDVPFCELLLEAGADVSATGPDGEDALDAALSRGEDEAAWLLMDSGAKARREMALGPGRVCAALMGGASESTVERLIAEGARAGRGGDGSVPAREAARKGRRGSLLALLSAGADPLERDEAGETPLESALRAFAERREGYLSEGIWRCAGALRAWRGKWEWSAPDGVGPFGRLLSGTIFPGIPKLEELEGWGADPAEPDGKGRSALHWAALAPVAERDAWAAALWALGRGASAGARASCGRLPWEMARDAGKGRLAERLKAESEFAELASIGGGERRGKSRGV